MGNLIKSSHTQDVAARFQNLQDKALVKPSFAYTTMILNYYNGLLLVLVYPPSCDLVYQDRITHMKLGLYRFSRIYPNHLSRHFLNLSSIRIGATIPMIFPLPIQYDQTYILTLSSCYICIVQIWSFGNIKHTRWIVNLAPIF